MLNERLKYLRNRLGMSQVEFANSIEVGQTTYSKWEVGESSPNSEGVAKIAKAHNVDANWLLLGIGELDLPETLAKKSKLTSIKKEEVKQVGNSEVSYWMTENSKLWKMIEWLQGQNEILLAK